MVLGSNCYACGRKNEGWGGRVEITPPVGHQLWGSRLEWGPSRVFWIPCMRVRWLNRRFVMALVAGTGRKFDVQAYG